MRIIYSSECERYAQAGHPESPERTRATSEYLRGIYDFVEPLPASEAELLLVHTRGHVKDIERGSFFDYDTPAYDGIYHAARLSAGGMIQAAQMSLAGEPVFSLMRPPGHHAGPANPCGFCYFNNVAIAGAKLLKEESVDRVAIVDFDVHHGNGTEEIFLGDQNVLYFSLHQSPLYPGTGLTSRDNCISFPMPPGTNSKRYLEQFDEGVERVRAFDPSIVLVSAGFDGLADDRIASFELSVDCYQRIGEKLKMLDVPVASALEGGYSPRLKECVHAYLKGLED